MLAGDGQLELIDDEAPGEDDAEADVAEAEADASDEHYVPPMSDEEQTINMQIDQDLLAVAVTDEDGFASTIVIPEEGAESLTTRSSDLPSSSPSATPESAAGNASKGRQSSICPVGDESRSM